MTLTKWPKPCRRKTGRAAAMPYRTPLRLTSIISPIDGIVGLAMGQVGDLVNPTSEILTTVSTVDPIKVFFTLNEQEDLSNTRDNFISVVFYAMSEVELIAVVKAIVEGHRVTKLQESNLEAAER